MQTKFSKLLVVGTIIIVVLLIGLFFIIPKKDKIVLPPKATVDLTTIRIKPTIGNPKAPVQIIAFEDLKCVNCKHFNDEFFTKIKALYIDNNIANYTLIVLAFVPGSIPAGNAAYCLYEQNSNNFFPFIEYLFAHQPAEENDWATLQTLLTFAKQSVPTANMEALEKCIFTGKYTGVLDDNLKMAMKLMKGNVATPAIYINGLPLDDFTLERIEQLITATKHQASQ